MKVLPWHKAYADRCGIYVSYERIAEDGSVVARIDIYEHHNPAHRFCGCVNALFRGSFAGGPCGTDAAKMAEESERSVDTFLAERGALLVDVAGSIAEAIFQW